MGWAVGFDPNWKRDIGYGVPALCDHPRCNKEIDRGLAYVCGSDVYGGSHGCGLFFCGDHLQYRTPRGEDRVVMNCKRCATYRLPYKPKPDVKEWFDHKRDDPSWAKWRAENPDHLAARSAGQ